MLKIRRSHDRLIFNMEIPILGKNGLYIKTGPWYGISIVSIQEEIIGMTIPSIVTLLGIIVGAELSVLATDFVGK